MKFFACSWPKAHKVIPTKMLVMFNNPVISDSFLIKHKKKFLVGIRLIVAILKIHLPIV